MFMLRYREVSQKTKGHCTYIEVLFQKTPFAVQIKLYFIKSIVHITNRVMLFLMPTVALVFLLSVDELHASESTSHV